MRNLVYVALCAIILSSCGTAEPINKGKVYPKMYTETPLAIAIMPPINKTNNVEAKEYFYITLPKTLSEKGYYVLSPFLTIDMFKAESAYDAERFINGDLNKFQSVLGADAMLFTTIHEWEKNLVLNTITVQIEYVLRSTKTNETLFTRKGTIVYEVAPVVTGIGGLGVGVVNAVAGAITTAATDYVKVANVCNNSALNDMPSGKYSPAYLNDKTQGAGPAEFKTKVKE